MTHVLTVNLAELTRAILQMQAEQSVNIDLEYNNLTKLTSLVFEVYGVNIVISEQKVV